MTEYNKKVEEYKKSHNIYYGASAAPEERRTFSDDYTSPASYNDDWFTTVSTALSSMNTD